MAAWGPGFYLLFSLLFILADPARSHGVLPCGRNHPELSWRYMDTEHFRIIYHSGLREVAIRCAEIAESVYGPITSDLGAEPDGRTPIVIADTDDVADGFSSVSGNHIFIWARSEDKFTTGDISWLRRIIAHEFTHIVTFYAVRLLPFKAFEIAAVDLMPVWFIEGVAQYEAEEWDENRDLLLRLAGANGGLVPPGKLSGFIGTDPIGSRMVYEEGHGLVRFIASKWGRGAIADILRNFSLFPLSFDWALSKVTGLGQRELFSRWREELEACYGHVIEGLEGPDDIGRRLELGVGDVHGVRFSPGGERIAFTGIEDTDQWIVGLYVLEGDGRMWTVDRGEIGSWFSWSPDGGRLVYSKAVRSEYGSILNRLFIADVGTGRRTMVGEVRRGEDPCWSPDGLTIAFVNKAGGRSELMAYDLRTSEVRRIFSPPGWLQISTPCWSPDGLMIACSGFEPGHRRDIFVVGRDGKGFRWLTDDPSDDRSPSWSPDGSRIAFISYRSGGRPNLFVLDLRGGEVEQMTDVWNGLFNPSWRPDGGGIAVISFGGRNRTWAYVVDPGRRRPGSRGRDLPGWSRAVSSLFAGRSSSRSSTRISSEGNYHPLLNVRSLLFLPWAGVDEDGVQLGFLNMSGDPVGIHNFGGYFLLNPSNHNFDFYIDYMNSRLPPLLRLTAEDLTKLDTEATGDSIWYCHTTLGVSAEFPFSPGGSIYSEHRVKLGLRREGLFLRRAGERPERSDFFLGRLTLILLGYRWIRSDPDVFGDINPRSGWNLEVGLEVSRWLSDLEFSRYYASFSFRREVIRGRRHVAGMRISSLYQRGDLVPQDMPGFGRWKGPVRGLSREIDGRGYTAVNLEYRIPLAKDLGISFLRLYFEGLTLSPFVDWGVVFPERGEGERVVSAGLLLRNRIYILGKFPVVLKAGVGMEVSRRAKPGIIAGAGRVF